MFRSFDEGFDAGYWGGFRGADDRAGLKIPLLHHGYMAHRRKEDLPFHIHQRQGRRTQLHQP